MNLTGTKEQPNWFINRSKWPVLPCGHVAGGCSAKCVPPPPSFPPSLLLTVYHRMDETSLRDADFAHLPHEALLCVLAKADKSEL